MAAKIDRATLVAEFFQNGPPDAVKLMYKLATAWVKQRGLLPKRGRSKKPQETAAPALVAKS